MNTKRRSRHPRSAAFTSPHRSNVAAGPAMSATLPLKRHKCRAPKASRHATIPERGRAARSSSAPAKAQQISTAPAPMLPLRPGRPRSVGCGFAALYHNPAESLRAARIFPDHARPVSGSSPSHSPAPNSPAKLGCVRPGRRRAPAARSSVSICARRTKAVQKFCALLPLPALRPGQPRSFGCGCAALCSSRLCGPKSGSAQ